MVLNEYGRTLGELQHIHSLQLPKYPTFSSQMPGKRLYSTPHSRPKRGSAVTPARNVSDLFRPKVGGRSSVGKPKMTPEQQFNKDKIYRFLKLPSTAVTF